MKRYKHIKYCKYDSQAIIIFRFFKRIVSYSKIFQDVNVNIFVVLMGIWLTLSGGHNIKACYTWTFMWYKNFCC